LGRARTCLEPVFPRLFGSLATLRLDHFWGVHEAAPTWARWKDGGIGRIDLRTWRARMASLIGNPQSLRYLFTDLCPAA